MNSTRKSLSLLVATTLLPLGTPTAGAVGLGELVTRSALGEPLRAEVRLVGVAGEELDGSCFKRVQGAGNDDIPWIHDARVRLAGDRLIVTTRDPMNHPIAMLGLAVACGGDVRRDYPIMLQPPVIRVGAGTSPNLPVAASADSIELRPEARPRETVRPPRPVRPQPAAGTETPGPANAAAPTPQPAKAPRRQAAPARRGEPPRHDRLILGSGLEAGLVPLRMSLALANPPSEDESDGARQQLRQEQRTLTEIDDRIAAQLEVNEKIKRLEEYQAMLKEKVAQLDGAPSSAPRPAAPPPAPAPAPVQPAAPAGFVPRMTEQLQQWGPTAGGLVAVLAGVGTLAWLRRRRKDEPFAEDTGEPTTQPDFRISAPPSTAGQQAEKKSAPLPPERDDPRLHVAQDSEPPPLVEHGGEWAEPTFAPAHPIPFDETVDEQDSALELAEIMMSFGRTQGAAETLADYIRNNPRQAVKPWLKLLEVYHVAGMRAEFEVLTRQLNKTFNVKMVSWNDFKDARATPDTVEQMAHICQRLQDLWGTQEAQIYIHQILRDNRNGTRQGFPLSVVEELLLLLAILDDELGTYKPPSEPTLEPMEAAAPPPATLSAFDA
ncbi:FimV family protein [Zoogloea sp.]|uniref:type IV pilus assembly protein FimV n=1 Tax=Zoogloea sp. TaxID=49181 RepID=UPI0035AF0143